MPQEQFGVMRVAAYETHSVPGLVALLQSFADAHQCLTNFDRALEHTGKLLLRGDVVKRATLLDAYAYFELRARQHRASLQTFLHGGDEPDRRLLWVPKVHRGELLIETMRMESPLDLSFIGNLNPLEVLRNYLKDRHERKLDLSYRARADGEERALKNLLLRSQVQAAQIANWEQLLRIAKTNGATEAQINKLLSREIGPVLERVGYVTDAMNAGVSGDEIVPLSQASPDWDHILRDYVAADGSGADGYVDVKRR